MIVPLLLLGCHPADELPRTAPTCEGVAPACSAAGCTGDGLWGFADLHTHPAMHLGFGDEDLFYGLPGMALSDDSLATDLPACDGDKHAPSTDPVLDMGRVVAYEALEGSGHGNHLPSGHPGFEQWPAARSPTHQQMHVEWIERAWRGGLRLLVASVTDNQLLETLWTRQTSLSLEDDLCGDSLDDCDTSGRDFDSAKRQLAFIHDLVAANEDWMSIVTSAEEADCAIGQGRLAVVLALEMDSLTVDQILELQRTHHVSLVTPIHLADHPDFGGTAVYSDVFNVLNRALRGEHFDVREDPDLTQRLGAPQTANDFPVLGPLVGLPWAPFAAQVSVGNGDESTCRQGYETCDATSTPAPAGHANVKGLAGAPGADAIRRLLDADLIVDVAHMSDRSQDEVLDLAMTLEVPVVDSHTGLRPPVPAEAELGLRHVSERDVREDHLDRIGRVGGVIGLGQAPAPRLAEFAQLDGSPIVRLDPDGVGKWSWDPLAPRLRLMVQTGGDDLCSGSSVDYVLEIDGVERSGTLQRSHDGRLEDLDTLRSGELDWIDVPLPRGTAAHLVSRLDLTVIDGGGDGCNGDDWTIDVLEVYFLGPDSAARLLATSGTPALELYDGDAVSLPLFPDGRAVLDVELWTGGDDLRCNARADLTLTMRDGTPWTDPTGQQLTPDDGLANDSHHSRPLALPAGYGPGDVEQLGITHTSGACDGSPSPDNWNLDRIRVARPEVDQDFVLIDRGAGPVFRFTGDEPAVALPLLPAIERRAVRADRLLVSVLTGSDNLDEGRTALLRVWIAGRNEPVAVDLNQGTDWRDRSLHQRWVDLGGTIDLDDIVAVEIVMSGGGAGWKVSRVRLEGAGTPVGDWWRDYETALTTLGRAPSFGTDFNGLQVLVDYAEVAPAYPLTPLGDPMGATLQAQQIGTRTADLRTEGLSNIGQLPDWIGAVGAATGDPSVVAPIYRSAESFVQMWYVLESR